MKVIWRPNMFSHFSLYLHPSKPDNFEALTRPINHAERHREYYLSELRLDLGQKGFKLPQEWDVI